MKKLALISVLLTIIIGSSFAQCSTKELKVRIDISSDDFGEETYWRLTDLEGTIFLKGGKNGVYGNLGKYSDSICIAASGCFFSKFLISPLHIQNLLKELDLA